jgi:hypothetical protein
MFKKGVFIFTDPICFCLEQKVGWNVKPGPNGAPHLQVTCQDCGVRVEIPSNQFLASVQFERPYPGKPKKKPAIEVQTPRAGDVIDLSEYLKRRKDGLPS